MPPPPLSSPCLQYARKYGYVWEGEGRAKLFNFHLFFILYRSYGQPYIHRFKLDGEAYIYIYTHIPIQTKHIYKIISFKSIFVFTIGIITPWLPGISSYYIKNLNIPFRFSTANRFIYTCTPFPNQY